MNQEFAQRVFPPSSDNDWPMCAAPLLAGSIWRFAMPLQRNFAPQAAPGKPMPKVYELQSFSFSGPRFNCSLKCVVNPQVLSIKMPTEGSATCARDSH
jgi:hypothetical protein